MDLNKDYYKILGVNKNASKDDIHKAFLKLSKKYHPDINHESGAKEKFQEISDANDILSDDNKRREYDFQREFAASGGHSQFFGGRDPFMDDFFNDGRTYTREFREPSHAPTKGDTINIDVSLPFESFFFGCSKTITIKKVISSCKHCKNGIRNSENPKYDKCPKCQGSGYITTQQGSKFQRIIRRTVCDCCGGSGYSLTNACPYCNGTSFGDIESKDIKFEIPKEYIKAGTNVFYKSFPNQGHAGQYSGERGDIELTVRLNADGNFFYQNYTINEFTPITTVHYISVLKAIVGGKEKILTPYGEKEVDIPALLKDEQSVMYPNLGLKYQSTNGYGALCVIFKYTYPSEFTNMDKSDILKIDEKMIKNNKFNDITTQNIMYKNYSDEYKKIFG